MNEWAKETDSGGVGPGELIAVLDVGKTISKLSLWSAAGEQVARETRANARVDAGRYAALDVEGIDGWIAQTLRRFAREGRVGAIVPVGHGAAAAVVRDGALAAPPLDYEEAIPEREAYDSQRDPFSETGSPGLPQGLNLGAQLHHLERLHPGILAPPAQILPWPQFWAWRLSGVAASEVTSLGCHSDLWSPKRGAPSPLARRRGWAGRLAPLTSADTVLGRLTPEWVRRTALPSDVRVYCGLHDSNAALLAARGFPEIAQNESVVLSTGTWFVAMRSPADDGLVDIGGLPEARDCLVNVDACGKLIPSARFMGGREIELLTAGLSRIDIKADQAALVAAAREVVKSGARVLPTFVPGVGPFSRQQGGWIDMPMAGAARRAAVSLYAALMADAALDLIGARERIVVEGRFAQADVFVRGLASLRPADRVFVSDCDNEVSFGALRLVDPQLRPAGSLVRARPLEVALEDYREAWREDVRRATTAA
jgi:sugar (pentulose or hexulose) kinase